jgi:hypothetical protein
LLGCLCEIPGQSSAGLDPGRPKLGDQVTRPVKRVSDVVRESIRSYRANYPNPHPAAFH